MFSNDLMKPFYFLLYVFKISSFIFLSSIKIQVLGRETFWIENPLEYLDILRTVSTWLKRVPAAPQTKKAITPRSNILTVNVFRDPSKKECCLTKQCTPMTEQFFLDVVLVLLDTSIKRQYISFTFFPSDHMIIFFLCGPEYFVAEFNHLLRKVHHASACFPAAGLLFRF